MIDIKGLIFDFEQVNNIKFRPLKSFYKKIGIKQVRWGQIVRNEVSPTILEVQNIANYFKQEYKTLLP